MDVHTTEQRSKNMAAIKATGTKPEIFLAKRLWALGYRYRKNNKTVFGKPDFTFKRYKIAIFIDSEFFHGKDFHIKKKPATNAEFWERKILGNIERDRRVDDFLTGEGWVVLRFWAKDVLRNHTDILIDIENVYNSKKLINM